MPSLEDEPFLIATSRLILVPHPTLVSHPSYLKLYADLHANDDFCKMGFGSLWQARQWTEEQTKDMLDHRKTWGSESGMGDFGVALKATPDSETALRIIKAGCGDEYDNTIRDLLEQKGVAWVGYVGVRDAITTSLPMEQYTADEEAALPHWNQSSFSSSFYVDPVLINIYA